MHRAIETRYKHRLFRSRLEARYAVLFDALAIRWDYEPEGFDLGDGLFYLPDFFLHAPPALQEQFPGAGYWVEIKGAPPSPLEIKKLSALCRQTGHHGYVFAGTPGEGSIHFCSLDGTWHGPVNARLDWSAPLMVCPTLHPSQLQRAYDSGLGRALSARFDASRKAST